MIGIGLATAYTALCLAGVPLAGYSIFYSTKELLKGDNVKTEKTCIKTWYNCMDGAGIKNHEEETFKPTSVMSTNFGYRITVKIPNGLSYDDLLKLNSKLDTSYNGIVDIRKGRFDKEATVNIVTKPFDNITYVGVIVKQASIIMCGYDYTGEPILIDMNEFPHVLIGGATGTGKSRCIYVILTNLVFNFGSDKCELYLCQVAKKDLIHFAKTENCKCYARNMAQSIKMLSERIDETHRREKLFEEAGVENIEEYNKKFPKKALPYCYIVGDEISFYMPDSTDGKQMRKDKAMALDYLKQLVKLARASGQFVIMATQKTDLQNMPSTVKNQTNLKISYRQTTTQSSINIIEDTKAVGLPKREAVVYTNEYMYMKTPFIDTEIINKYIEERIVPGNIIKIDEVKKEREERKEEVNNLGIIED